VRDPPCCMVRSRSITDTTRTDAVRLSMISLILTTPNVSQSPAPASAQRACGRRSGLGWLDVISSLATKPHTDSLAKYALSLGRNSDGARAFKAPYPAFFQAACAQCRCDGTSQV
jgi:hypothetical protein